VYSRIGSELPQPVGAMITPEAVVCSFLPPTVWYWK
jgi:hypothetical protein